MTANNPIKILFLDLDLDLDLDGALNSATISGLIANTEPAKAK